MSNTLFAAAREAFGTAQLSWTAGTWRVAALKQGYTLNPELADYLSDVDVVQRVAISNPITGRSMSKGWFLASPTLFPTTVDANLVGSLVVYRDTGVEATSDLVIYIRDARSMPFRFTGGSVYVVWQVGNSGVFRL